MSAASQFLIYIESYRGSCEGDLYRADSLSNSFIHTFLSIPMYAWL